MFCRNCGAQLPDNTTFCSMCGTRVGEGQQTGIRPESQPKAGGKAANTLRMRKVLIGLGVGVVGVILFILLLISVFYPKSKYFRYEYHSGGTATISGNHVSTEDKELITEITISSKVRHGRTFSVTSIGPSAFRGCSSLTSIEIPDSVTSIEEEAFRGCSGLTSIEIPDSVTSIESWAFYGCSSLTSIEIPDSVVIIGVGAFRECSSLTSIEIPDSAVIICPEAFSGCSSLTSIEIPDSVTGIGEYAFHGCSSLTSIEIPDSVTSISAHAFGGCSSLTSIEIPGSVTEIVRNAFEGCSSLTSIIIAGVKVTKEDISNDTWKDVVRKSNGNENAGGYTRSDFVSDQAYQNYLLWGDTSGLKNKK